MLRAAPSSPSPAPLAKRAAHGSSPVRGLASLPPSIAQTILLMAVMAVDQKALTVENAGHTAAFGHIAQVSKPWRALALEAASAVALSSLVVRVGKATRSELLEVRRQLTLRRAFLLTFEVTQLPEDRLIRARQWVAVLSCAPRLQEIKLDGLRDPTNEELGAVVRAAGRQCKNLEALVVSEAYSNNENVFYPVESVRRQLSDPVYYAMEQVYKNTNHVGLRRLCVCLRFDLQGLESTRKYIDHVLRYCPNIERFDGYRAAVFESGQRLAYEQWFMDTELWTRFCATLKSLNGLSWTCVPFATRYFEIFGQHLKPEMEALTFTTATNWTWDRFMRDIGPHAQELLTESGGYAGTAKNAHAALRACPNLKQLIVAWHDRPLPLSRVHPPLPTLPVKTMMDPAIFGDEFWEAAVQLCPYVRTINVEQAFASIARDIPAETLTAFTDRSLMAIKTLPWLTYFKADAINVTGAGLFELAANHAALRSKYRYYEILLGHTRMEATDESFYHVVRTFLETMLAADAPLPCQTRKVTMSISNRRETPVIREWSETAFVVLKQLLEQVHIKHPGVGVALFLSGFGGTHFGQIEELVFHTDPTDTAYKKMHRAWEESDNRRIAGSIWERLDYYDDDDDEDDDEDDDDESEDGDEDDEDDDEYWRSGEESRGD